MAGFAWLEQIRNEHLGDSTLPDYPRSLIAFQRRFPDAAAWLLCAKLRAARADPQRKPLAGLLEIDETTIHYRHRQAAAAGATLPPAVIS